MVYILQFIFHTSVFTYSNTACKGVFNPNILIYHPPNSTEGLHFSAFHYFLLLYLLGVRIRIMLATFLRDVTATFLSVTDTYIRTYARHENRSRIRKLAMLAISAVYILIQHTYNNIMIPAFHYPQYNIIIYYNILCHYILCHILHNNILYHIFISFYIISFYIMS